ncbi:MAG: hypothetical protein H9535_21470 [Ignavibacteria bacterium]|nr:hypothetical protein [Ignavibacteria bacterium]
MSSKQIQQDTTIKNDKTSLRARAQAFDEKMQQIKGSRPTMQKIVEECRIVREEMYKERSKDHSQS